jgi:hypothetical protein
LTYFGRIGYNNAMMKGKVVNNDRACIFGEADWITAEQAEWRASRLALIPTDIERQERQLLAKSGGSRLMGGSGSKA